LGIAIADHYGELSSEEQFLVFDVIERGMKKIRCQTMFSA